MNPKPCVILAVFFLTHSAYALGGFPGQIEQHLNLASAPQCNLCHASTAGGGPVVQPFGKAMLAAGLTSTGGGTLTRALDQLKADGTDSDGDGVGDIDELVAGTNPNPDKTPIEYGCGGQIASHQLGASAPLPVGLLVWAILWSRRRWGGSADVHPRNTSSRSAS